MGPIKYVLYYITGTMPRSNDNGDDASNRSSIEAGQMMLHV